ncbi:MAG: hypothetical protein GXX85_17225, partial [Ignavibacteria bacterium]|nr:hypothetical protein [Ignavibacteria bacterium]
MIKNIMLCFLLTISVLPQSYWEIADTKPVIVNDIENKDTSDANLKSIINNPYSIPREYYAAAIILANRGEKEFLLETMKMEVPDTNDYYLMLKGKENLLTNLIIMGYYGKTEAITGLTRILNDLDTYNWSIAVKYLTEVDDYSYFDDVKTRFLENPNNGWMSEVFYLYALKESYKAEAEDIISRMILNNDEYFSITSILLGKLNKALLIETLNNKLTNTDNTIIRQKCYYFLNKYDNGNIAEHTMKMIETEINADVRAYDYYPDYKGSFFSPMKATEHYDVPVSHPNRFTYEYDITIHGDNCNPEKRPFLQTKFVKFLLDRIPVEQAENCGDCIDRISEYLESFKPFKPDSTHSLQYLMDDFQNYLEEVNNYGWINENTKYAEYKTQLEYAETKIANNEFEECRMKLEEYKNGIQNDFDNGLITNE